MPEHCHGQTTLAMDRGRLVEDGAPAQIFGGARIEWARAFVDKILRH
jgi:hypothetical protein